MYDRMNAVGIERSDRNLSFHSARRFFNTLLRRSVSGDVLRKMTGHDSDEMTEHYTDYLPEDLSAIADAQAKLAQSSSSEKSVQP
jgi:integrase